MQANAIRANNIRVNKKQSNRLHFAVLAVLLIFAWIMFGFNYSNADYGNYEAAYNDIKAGGTNAYLDVGFSFLMKLCGLCGLSYQGFMIVISALCLLIFTLALRRLTKSVSVALAFYIVYPFVFDIVQYRNFLAFAFVLYGLRFLLKDKVRIKDIALYLVFVLIGSLIHLSVIIYSAFILVAIKRFKPFAVLTGILLALITFLIINNEILNRILMFLRFDRFVKYDADYNYSTFAQYFVLYLFFMFLAGIKFKNKFQSNKFKLLLVASLFLPFIIMTGTSARFIRNTFILFYAFLLDTNGCKFSKMSLKQIFIHLALFASILFVFYAQLTSGLYYDIVLQPILKYNLIFGK